MVMMLPISLLALATGALGEGTPAPTTCETYDERYADTNFSSTNLNQNDPCFGYSKSCCEDLAATMDCCYWKTTAWCQGTNPNAAKDCSEDDGALCPACCASTPNMTAECTPTQAPTPKPTTTAPPTVVEVTTAAPTMHSAKKWERLHPDYQGGDGELLWSIYYGEYAVDVRFDAFRANQMWDAAVVRPMIEMDLNEDAVDADAEGVSAHWAASEGTTTTAVETTSTCESYAEKYLETNFSSSNTKDNDPCFGYTESCCDSNVTTGGCCYWKSTNWCTGAAAASTCDEDDGADCPACCASVADDTEECTFTEAPTPQPSTTTTTEPPTPKPTTTTAKPTWKPTTTTTTTTSTTERPVTTEAPAPTIADTTAAPTMHSAKKWTMLHPDYQGGDGELLWNIYYGEYAADERFDGFRSANLWDADVIRPMIMADVDFARFHKANKSNSSTANTQQWMVLAAAAIVIVAAFAMWLRQRGSYQKIVDPVEKQGLLASYGN